MNRLAVARQAIVHADRPRPGRPHLPVPAIPQQAAAAPQVWIGQPDGVPHHHRGTHRRPGRHVPDPRRLRRRRPGPGRRSRRDRLRASSTPSPTSPAPRSPAGGPSPAGPEHATGGPPSSTSSTRSPRPRCVCPMSAGMSSTPHPDVVEGSGRCRVPRPGPRRHPTRDRDRPRPPVGNPSPHLNKSQPPNPEVTRISEPIIVRSLTVSSH